MIPQEAWEFMERTQNIITLVTTHRGQLSEKGLM